MTVGPIAAVFLVLLLLGVGCSSSENNPVQSTPVGSEIAPVPADAWPGALQTTPHPYLMPLPEPTRTMVDGTYAKFDLKETPPVHCLRCPDYIPEGGVWKLHLDRGIYRVFHEVTGWHSMGSFVLAKDLHTSGTSDQLLLFNDPACPGAVGLYEWTLEDGELLLEVLEDSCAIHLRAMNLTNLPWLSCQPPNIEAGITDHWLKPPGCQ